jgi:hypothetical protein
MMTMLTAEQLISSPALHKKSCKYVALRAVVAYDFYRLNYVKIAQLVVGRNDSSLGKRLTGPGGNLLRTGRLRRFIGEAVSRSWAGVF